MLQPGNDLSALRSKSKLLREVLRANNEFGSRAIEIVPVLTFEDVYRLQKQKYKQLREALKSKQTLGGKDPDWKLEAEEIKHRESQQKLLRDLRHSDKDPVKRQEERIKEIVQQQSH